MLKKTFVSGLVLLLPVVITLLIIEVISNLLTRPFIEWIQPILLQTPLNRPFLCFSAQQVVSAASQSAILICLTAFIFLLGMAMKSYFLRYFFLAIDFILLHIPLLNSLYKTAQELVKMLLGAQASAFKQVAIVPFPRPGVYSIGFITKETPHPSSQLFNTELISVLVPTTPNPTSGLLMLFKKEEVIYTDIPVKDAVKFILSCGVIHGAPDRVISAIGADKDAHA